MYLYLRKAELSNANFIIEIEETPIGGMPSGLFS